MENIFDQHASSDIIFRIEDFEGPIAVLVNLCEKNGYDVHTVRISDITDQYLKYMEGIETRMDLDRATDFLLMAATLLEIKAKSSLPRDDEEEIDEEEELDSEEEILRRMAEYKIFCEKAQEIKEQETLNRFYREPQFDDDDARVSITGFNIDKLMEAYAKIMYRFGHIEDTSEVKTIEKDDYTVADKLDQLVQKLIANQRISFFEQFDEAFSKSNVISTFLAILQLVGKQFATISQENNYGDIIISLNEDCDPSEYDYSMLAMSDEFDNSPIATKELTI